MALIVDTGPLVAALDLDDPDHERCSKLLLATRETRVVPSPVLVEVNYWVVKRGGPAVWREFVADIVGGAYRVEHLSEADLTRAAEFEERYGDLRLGLVDASVMAVCERLGETKVATLDRRHFTAVRPGHCSFLDILPN